MDDENRKNKCGLVMKWLCDSCNMYVKTVSMPADQKNAVTVLLYKRKVSECKNKEIRSTGKPEQYLGNPCIISMCEKQDNFFVFHQVPGNN